MCGGAEVMTALLIIATWVLTIASCGMVIVCLVLTVQFLISLKREMWEDLNRRE